MTTTQNRRKMTALEYTAYHEAGHAAAGRLLDRPPKRVTIVPDEEAGSLGGCESFAMPSFKPDMGVDLRTRFRIECECTILLAGPVAEARVRGRRNQAGAAGDYRTAVRLAEFVCKSEREIEKYLDWLTVKAEELLAVPWHWAGVVRVAECLVAQRTLSGRAAVEAFCQGASCAIKKSMEASAEARQLKGSES